MERRCCCCTESASGTVKNSWGGDKKHLYSFNHNKFYKIFIKSIWLKQSSWWEVGTSIFQNLRGRHSDPPTPCQTLMVWIPCHSAPTPTWCHCTWKIIQIYTWIPLQPTTIRLQRFHANLHIVKYKIPFYWCIVSLSIYLYSNICTSKT